MTCSHPGCYAPRASHGMCPAHKAMQRRLAEGRPTKREVLTKAQYALGLTTFPTTRSH